MINLVYKVRPIFKKEKKNFKNFIKYLLNLTKILLIIIYYKNRNKIFKINYNKNQNFFSENSLFVNIYLKLVKMPSYINNSLLIEERNCFLNYLSQMVHKNINFIDTIFFTNNLRFGNSLTALNKIIFYCEIIGCKKIILDKTKFWFIKNKLIFNESNLTLDVNYKNEYNNSNILYYDSNNIFYYVYKINPEIKINFLKNEIIKYLPKFEISKDYLYIHLRGEDIFDNNINIYYAQPPLCFYKSILNSFFFKKIYLISKDKNNPVFKKLINLYPFIEYKNNSLTEDISYLINAYNIVASKSSFIIFIIRLNTKLEYLWDYNFYHIIDKIRHYHYDLYKLDNSNLTIYRMESSTNYKEIMYNWKNNRKQNALMIKGKCKNFFSIINYK